MKRAEKQALVEQMEEAFARTPHVVLTSFRGLKANQANDLRSRIRRAGGTFQVVKNRLAKRAAPGSAVDRLVPQLSGPCALAGHASDPVAMAKLLSEFAKENPQLELVAAVVDAREIVDAAGVKRLASLPGIAELRAQLLALVQTPATSLVRLIGTPGTQLARALDARREKLEGAA